MDLRDALQELAGQPNAPTQGLKDADLARGRRAARSRRVRLVSGSIGVAVALTAVSVAVVPDLRFGPFDNTAAPSTTVSERPWLLEYQGKQPKLFTIGKIPDGWFVQNVNDDQAFIAPDRVKNPGPSVDPSKAPIYDPANATDKILVMVRDMHDGLPQGKKIKVGGRDGLLYRDERGPAALPGGQYSLEPERADGNYGGSVFVKRDDGSYLVTQFWGGLPFTEQQMIEIAANMHFR